jgi:Carboxypeptidase regulatory-like domain
MHAFVLFIERNSFDASYGVHYDPSAIQVDLQLHAIDRDDSPGGARMRRIIGARLLASTVAVVMFGVWAGRVEAQAVYGSISGTIVDNTGAVLPGVTVTIVSVERKTSDEVVTNESGFYVKDRLLPGMYEVRAELSGFKQAVFSSIVVNVDTNTPLNIKLEIGQVAEQITVTGFSPLLRTDRADVATRFDEKQITDLPVLDRNFTKFVLLTPGTQQLGWQHAASENPQGSTQTMVNGQHFSGTTYQLDGTENRRLNRSKKRKSRRRTTMRSSVRRRLVSFPCRPSRAPMNFTAARSSFSRATNSSREIPSPSSRWIR